MPHKGKHIDDISGGQIVSMHSTLQTPWYGGTLPWKYTGTPYEKEIDSEGITTDFIRCTDPTAAGIVMKIIRTKIG